MTEHPGSRKAAHAILLLVAAAVPVAVTIVVASRHSWPIAIAITVIYGLVLTLARFATKVFKRLEDGWVDSVANGVDTALRQRFTRFGTTYRSHLEQSHRFVDLRGLGTQGPATPRLEQVFVDVGLVSRPAHLVTGDPILLESEAFSYHRRRSVWDFINSDDRSPIVIVGAAGSGKTTLVKYVAVQLSRVRSGRLPILLYLREHIDAIVSDDPKDLVELVRCTLGALAEKEPAGWLTSQLGRGSCVVLLDGLDEVANEEDRKQVVAWVDRQISTYPRNQFILTSRPHGYRPHPLRAATVLQVRPFTPSQIDQFVYRWYIATQISRTGVDDPTVRADATRDAEDLLTRLQTSTDLYDLAVNPLLLTMIANVHCYRGALPGSRSDLYGEICQVFLGKRQQAKGLGENLRADQKEVVLRHLALHMMTQRIRDIAPTEAANAIHDVLSAVADDTEPIDFLRSIEEESALFLEREADKLAFTHLTFQEYLAAMHIKEEGTAEFLVPFVSDPWWHETILLYTARADAGPVIEACLAEQSAEALELALGCLDEAQRLDGRLRNRVEHELLGGDDDEDMSPERRRLRSATLLGRKVKQVMRIASFDSHLIQAPITNEEYDLFRADLRPSRAVLPSSLLPDDRLVPDQAHMRANPPEPAVPVTGIRGSDAARFAEWLTALRGDGWTYRLPTTQEAADQVFSRILDKSCLTFWVQDDQDGAGDATRSLYGNFSNDPVDVRRRLSQDVELLARRDGQKKYTVFDEALEDGSHQQSGGLWTGGVRFGQTRQKILQLLSVPILTWTIGRLLDEGTYIVGLGELGGDVRLEVADGTASSYSFEPRRRSARLVRAAPLVPQRVINSFDADRLQDVFRFVSNTIGHARAHHDDILTSGARRGASLPAFRGQSIKALGRSSQLDAASSLLALASTFMGGSLSRRAPYSLKDLGYARLTLVALLAMLPVIGSYRTLSTDMRYDFARAEEWTQTWEASVKAIEPAVGELLAGLVVLDRRLRRKLSSNEALLLVRA